MSEIIIENDNRKKPNQKLIGFIILLILILIVSLAVGIKSFVDDYHRVCRITGYKAKTEQDAFIESMAAAAQAVHDYFGNGERILYINVANNLSVDCDCDSHPADPEMNDIGILASLDPVALDQACVDLVFHYPSKEGDDAAALIERINTRHGIHILEHAAQIGLGSREYQLVSLDEK